MYNGQVKSIVWYDGNVNSSDNKSTQSKLRSEGLAVHAFADSRQAKEFLARQGERHLVITCGSSGEAFVREVHASDVVASIVVFTSKENVSRHKIWSSAHPKVIDVVATTSDLRAALQAAARQPGGGAPATPSPAPTPAPAPAAAAAQSGSASSGGGTRRLAAGGVYEPLERLLKRRRENSSGYLRRLEARLPRSLEGRPPMVRFVAVSDTHGRHEKVVLPAGEVLLYLGDAIGNFGGKRDLHREYRHFLVWLGKQSQRFQKVFWIAGNHETILDDREGGAAAGKEQVQNFQHAHPNCQYLENSPAEYRGLKLWASPVTICRKETQGKRFYSRAFERKASERRALWQGVPDGLDVLMTHVPPRGSLSSSALGCSLLRDHLAQLARPPRFHVFGHDHDFLGVEQGSRTVRLNVAQDELLGKDPAGGGCPLTFDVSV